MDGQTLAAVGGAVGAVLTGAAGVIVGLRKGRAESKETEARADVLLSTEARAIMGDLRAELAIERAERRREEDEHAVTRGRLTEAERKIADQAREIADLQRDLAALIKEVHRLGGHVPGETPAHGTPLVGPAVEPGTGE